MEAWFIAVEAMFEHCRIRDDTSKYFKALPALPLETIDKLNSFLQSEAGKYYFNGNSRDSHSYNRLKVELLKIYKESTSDRLKRLFGSISLAEMRPSELLQEMIKRAGPNVPETDVEPFWLALLPDEMKSVGALKVALNEKGQEADMIFDKIVEKILNKAATKPSPEVAPATKSEVQELREEIKLLRAELAEMKKLLH